MVASLQRPLPFHLTAYYNFAPITSSPLTWRYVLFFNEDAMNRSRLLFVACITLSLTVSFAVAAAAFRATAPSVSRVGTVTPATPMLEPRSGQTATLLPDGRVLIAGGMRRNQDFYKSAELYDPTTGKFQPTGEMAERRVGHIAVLLRSGKVLVAGGWVGRGATDSAELYDPATGKFTAIAKLTARRGEPRATMLANGDVLVTGGDDHDGPSGHLASAEVFRAATLSFQATGAMHHARGTHSDIAQRREGSDRWRQRRKFERKCRALRPENRNIQ